MKKVLVVGIVGESVFMKCDHFHKEGETVRVDNIYTEIGGKGFNQALTIKELGGDVQFVCALGNDKRKDLCVEKIKSLGIPFKYFIDIDELTAYANILTNKAGDNRVSVYSGAKLNANNLDEIYKEIDDAEYILIQLEIPLDVNLAIAKYAKLKNKTVILNPAPVDEIKELLEYVDIITPNEIEAISLFGENYIENLLKQNFKTIVTRGSKSTLLIDKEVIKFETKKVNVVDTTGAGDVFNGALVYMLSRGKSLMEALNYAGNAASYSVQYNYVLPGIIRLSHENYKS